MELFFPLIGVFAVAVATVAATACILVPGPQHLVSKVFFGTIGFIFGGAVCTAIVSVIFSLSLNELAPSFHPGATVVSILACTTFILLGAASSWVAIKFVESFLESLRYGKKENRSVAPSAPETASILNNHSGGDSGPQ